MSTDNIFMNSCQYTPVYFIESPGVSQARSYVITQNNQEVEKSASVNLKRFYENSGNLETNLSAPESSPKLIFQKKTENNVVRNNLKLASFLLPKSEIKSESCKPITTPVNNVVLKPVYIANPGGPNTVPRVDVNSKIVMLKDCPNVIRSQNGKILPKIKPKENTSNKSKHTSVQLLKLGETYHSLNQLSDDQMKIVNHALKIFSDPQGSTPEPTYDPVTNTKYIYKVVSPRDLAVVGNNKTNKQQRFEVKPETQHVEKVDFKSESVNIEDYEEETVFETKITRSGRIVKSPKSILTESPNKPRRKSAKFMSPHRLHRHEHHNLTNHSDLFQCMLNIIKTGSDNTFIQQIEQFIRKLKSCISCLLADMGKGTPSIINEDVARLLGINPGKYNLNLDALSCEKDKNGYCIHNPPLPTTDIHKPNILEKTKTNTPDLTEYILLNVNKSDEEKTTQTNIVKKIESRKQKFHNNHSDNGKKMKITPDIDKNIAIDDFVALLSDTEKTECSIDKTVDNVELGDQDRSESEKVPLSSKPTHIQFRSTHFDIRSSPIKSSSTVFRKFQINPAKMAKYEVEINKLAQDIEMTNVLKDKIQQNNSDTTAQLPTENINKTAQENSKPTEVWTEQLQYDKSLINQPDDFLKPDVSIEPSLIHAKDDAQNINNVMETDDVSQSQSIISFLESLGNELYSESDKNNPVDFQLDLFSFNT